MNGLSSIIAANARAAGKKHVRLILDLVVAKDEDSEAVRATVEDWILNMDFIDEGCARLD